MIAEIIWYNLAWFVVWALSGMIGGIIWEWHRTVALIIFVCVAMLIVVSIVCTVSSVCGADAGGAFSNVRQWYYFIGSACGGIVWTMMFRVGRDMYRNGE